MSYPIGYCTNVHPGSTLEQTFQQLSSYAVSVRKQLDIPQMGVGLWLNNQVADDLTTNRSELNEFSNWLSGNGLVPYTLNGFPYGNFHQEVVKQDVYLPDWTQPDRLNYTISLAKILTTLVGPSSSHFGTISTLPIGWSKQKDEGYKAAAAENYLKLVEFLRQWEEESGTRIQVCIEPEPGCTLGDMKSTVEFFNDYLSPSDSERFQSIRRYLSICYDTCHAAVMNESVKENLQLIGAQKIEIGKVQVSNAPRIQFDSLEQDAKDQVWETLKEFAEPKYLHQTGVYWSDKAGQQSKFFEDLPLALEDKDLYQKGTWVVHFHVPIDCQSIGHIRTTADHNVDLIEQAQKMDVKIHHWEVETYAWNVLPKSSQPPELSEGITKEVAHLNQLLKDTPWQKS